MDEKSSRKSGRKQGTWSLAIRVEAKRLYLTGLSLAEISQQLGVGKNTMMYWRRIDGWVKEKRARILPPAVLPSQPTFTEITSQKREAIDLYTKLITQAKQGVDDQNLFWRDKKQAADALVAGVKGLAEIFEKNVNIAFLQEVAQIIIDEIQDETLRQRVGARLISLGRAWNARGTAS